MITMQSQKTNEVIAIASGESIVHAIKSFEHWVDIGRQIAAEKRAIDWKIADWFAYGQEHYGEQLVLALPELTSDTHYVKALKLYAKVAKAVTPNMRSADLEPMHYAHVIDLPDDEAEQLLQDAKKYKLTARQIRINAEARKVAIGQRTIFKEDDLKYKQHTALARAWNCALYDVRSNFYEMIDTNDFGLILD